MPNFEKSECINFIKRRHCQGQRCSHSQGGQCPQKARGRCVEKTQGNGNETQRLNRVSKLEKKHRT